LRKKKIRPVLDEIADLQLKTATRHTSAEFVAFLTNIVTNQPRAERVTSSPTTDLGEPQLHVVEPGGVRRTEVNMNALP
jgi:hypothetical protein